MFINKGKTNWFYVIIVALIAGAVGGISVTYVNNIMAQEEMDYADAVIYRKAPSPKTFGNGEFTGTYSFNWAGGSVEDQPSGKLLVEQTSEKEISFALSLGGAAPAFDSGRIYAAKAALNGNTALYQNSEFGNCKFELIFDADKATIKAVEGANSGSLECGFGHSVYADGIYVKNDAKTPVFPKPGDPVF